jgi:integrase
MFAWGMREGLATFNPVINTNKRDETPRERVLSDAELAAIWHALPDGDFGVVIKLLMLTGQRSSEIAGLRWPEIDFERGLISLPPGRVKNARAHDIPMARTVTALLQMLPRREGRDMVFGRRGGTPFGGWSSSKHALDARVGLAHWTVHDLRRSVATGMAGIGIQPHVIEAVLNHVSGHKGGIAGIYNRAQYSAEKAEALARWDKHISAILDGGSGSVKALRRAGV